MKLQEVLLIYKGAIHTMINLATKCNFLRSKYKKIVKKMKKVIAIV